MIKDISGAADALFCLPHHLAIGAEIEPVLTPVIVGIRKLLPAGCHCAGAAQVIDISVQILPAGGHYRIVEIVPYVMDLLPAVLISLSVGSEVSPAAFMIPVVAQLSPFVEHHFAAAVHIVGVVDQAVGPHHAVGIHIVPFFVDLHPVVLDHFSCGIIVVIPVSIFL